MLDEADSGMRFESLDIGVAYLGHWDSFKESPQNYLS